MLWCQKVPRIFGRSASLRNAPSLGGFRLTPPISTSSVSSCGVTTQVRAVGAQFAVDLVADIGGDGDHRGGNGHAESDGDTGEQLAPRLAAERFVDEAWEHYFCSK